MKKKILIIPHTEGTHYGTGRYTRALYDGLRAKGVDVSFVSTRLHGAEAYLRGRPLQFLSDVLRLRRELKRARPDVVHITIEPYLLLVPFLPLRGVRVVLSAHGTYSYLPPVSAFWIRPLVRFVSARAMARVDVLLALSRYTRDYMLREGGAEVPARKLHVFTLGISTQAYPFVPETGNSIKRILTVAPLKGRKGVEEALQAVALYRTLATGPFEYRIVGSTGEPELLASFRQKAQALGVGEQVRFLGRLSEEDLLEEYKSADAYLMLPRIVERHYFEGLGLVYLEANACGVPTVGSDSGGVPDAIKDGVSGFCVGGAEAAAQALYKILEEEKIARVDARAWAEAHDPQRVLAQLIELYEHR